ncbi:SDR family NAD(P)-dependent oxidoreductase [Agrobacterium salinitolerans]|uniref:SDR family NAD(P)-dependent oxidoreductase n=1 Tax=Agrobacterium salinitolerans TaxID=1183413 RepID=UPI00345E0D72
MAEAGVTVLMAARDVARGEAAARELSQAGLTVEAIEMNLNREETIPVAAKAILDRHGRLDILVNNAGIVDPEDGPPSAATVAAARRLMETNFLGTLAVTQAMLPLLLKSSAGRIVNLATTLGSLSINSDPTSPYYEARLIGYNASKAALNMLTVQLAAELKGTSIVVNSVAPGYVKTGLTGGKGYMTPAEGARLPSNMLCSAKRRLQASLSPPKALSPGSGGSCGPANAGPKQISVPTSGNNVLYWTLSGIRNISIGP